jgi:hypothetical protein
MEALKHSFEKAAEIQKAFESRFAHSAGVVGVGLSMNDANDDLAINVQVAGAADVKQLPKRFDGLDVVVDVVGAVRAL